MGAQRKNRATRGPPAQPAVSMAQSDHQQVRERISAVLRESNRFLLPPGWSVIDESSSAENAPMGTAFSAYELEKNRKRLGLYLLIETTSTGLVRAYLGTQSATGPVKSAILPFGFEATRARSFGLRSARRLFNRLSGRLECWETLALLGFLA